MGARIAAHFANAGVPGPSARHRAPQSAATAMPQPREAWTQRLKNSPGAFYLPPPPSLVTNRQLRGRPRQRSPTAIGLSKPSPKIWRSSAPCSTKWLQHRKPGTPSSPPTPAAFRWRSIAEGFPSRLPPAFFRHAFLQPAALPAPGRRSSRAPKPPPEVLRFARRLSAIATSAKAWCPAKTRRTSSPTASAVSLASTVQKLTVEKDFTIEEVDALTGPLIGLPKSASYRLLDIVGLDVWAHVTKNLYDARAQRSLARRASCCRRSSQQMIERGWLGDKTRPGLLQTRRQGRKRFMAIDLETLEYQPRRQAAFCSRRDGVRNIENLPRAAARADGALTDRAGTFLWQAASATWCSIRPA